MSTYTDASLIVTPNSKKAGKLYSLKPTDGTGDLDVVRATTATYVGSDGLIKTASANEVRFDYTNGSCPSILVEPQRTNKCPNSLNYGTNAIGTNATRDIISSPSGISNADRLIDDNSNGEHLFGQYFDSISNGQTYTFSCFFKSDNTGGRAVIRYYGGEWVYAVYNLQNGTISETNGSVTSKIQNYGNGWFRCILTHTAVSDYSIMITQIGIANSNNQFFYQGASSLGIYFWGFQAEQGNYETSLIYSNGTSVTRNADVISKSGLSGITSITETFENETTNVISGSPTSYTMSQGRIKHVIGI